MSALKPPGYSTIQFVDGPAEGHAEVVSRPLPPMALFWLAGTPDIAEDNPVRVSRPVDTTTYYLRKRIGRDGYSEWVYSIHAPTNAPST